MSLSSDIKQKGIKIKLDKERKLIFDLNAFAELEDRYGSMEKAMESLSTGSMKAIRFMLYVALLNDDETLTEKEVGKLIDLDNINEVANSLNKAMSGSLPDGDGEEKN